MRRIAAGSALALAAFTTFLALYVVIEQFPRGLIVLGCVALALAAAWYGLLRRGAARLLGVGTALLAIAAIVLILVLDGDHVAQAVLIGLGVGLTPAAARAAFRRRVSLAPAARPEHPVLFYNPKSGGGKAEIFSLDAEARARGIEPVELTPGADLRELVRAAVARGADGLAMAGGDGSQAIVAEIASEHGLPYACIPAGTRNHFALDLGVDRDDVVGALDAFVEGGEHRVDLGEVNGRVFVNNVSLGLYADAVQRPGYREAKLRT
ncbi:MAG TPA: diacylglycerol kinase family protein, partial [Solirubrobacterales bacterium]